MKTMLKVILVVFFACHIGITGNVAGRHCTAYHALVFTNE